MTRPQHIAVEALAALTVAFLKPLVGALDRAADLLLSEPARPAEPPARITVFTPEGTRTPYVEEPKT